MFTKHCYLQFNISVETTSLFPTNLVFDEFKIKVVEFEKFTTNFQIKPLQTKRSY